MTNSNSIAAAAEEANRIIIEEALQHVAKDYQQLEGNELELQQVLQRLQQEEAALAQGIETIDSAIAITAIQQQEPAPKKSGMIIKSQQKKHHQQQKEALERLEQALMQDSTSSSSDENNEEE
jgi:hypothetical protein